MHSQNQSKFRRSLYQVIAVLIAALLLAACGGGNQEASNHPAGDEQANSAQQSVAANESNTAASGTTVNVVARDFEFILDANSAPAGQVTFVLTNQGAMPHDFAITINGEQHKTQMVQPGASGSVTVDLAPGSYEYICTVPGHDILGMKGTFTVE